MAHEKGIEGSRFNTISSMVVKGECYCVRLQNSDLALPLRNPGQIKPPRWVVSSSVKACLTRLLKGLNTLIHINNEESCMIHNEGSINKAMMRAE